MRLALHLHINTLMRPKVLFFTFLFSCNTIAIAKDSSLHQTYLHVDSSVRVERILAAKSPSISELLIITRTDPSEKVVNTALTILESRRGEIDLGSLRDRIVALSWGEPLKREARILNVFPKATVSKELISILEKRPLDRATAVDVLIPLGEKAQDVFNKVIGASDLEVSEKLRTLVAINPKAPILRDWIAEQVDNSENPWPFIEQLKTIPPEILSKYLISWAGNASLKVRNFAITALAELEKEVNLGLSPLPKEFMTLMRTFVQKELRGSNQFDVAMYAGKILSRHPELLSEMKGDLLTALEKNQAVDFAAPLISQMASNDVSIIMFLAQKYLDIGDEYHAFVLKEALSGTNRGDLLVPFFLDHLDSDNAQIHRRSIKMFPSVIEGYAGDITQLQGLLKSSDKDTRQRAAGALAKIGRTKFENLNDVFQEILADDENGWSLLPYLISMKESSWPIAEVVFRKEMKKMDKDKKDLISLFFLWNPPGLIDWIKNTNLSGYYATANMRSLLSEISQTSPEALAEVIEAWWNRTEQNAALELLGEWASRIAPELLTKWIEKWDPWNPEETEKLKATLSSQDLRKDSLVQSYNGIDSPEKRKKFMELVFRLPEEVYQRALHDANPAVVEAGLSALKRNSYHESPLAPDIGHALNEESTEAVRKIAAELLALQQNEYVDPYLDTVLSHLTSSSSGIDRLIENHTYGWQGAAHFLRSVMDSSVFDEILANKIEQNENLRLAMDQIPLENPTVSTRDALCSLVASLVEGKLSPSGHVSPYSGSEPRPYYSALTNLQALLLVRAARYCPQARQAKELILTAFFPDRNDETGGCGNETLNSFSDLRNLYKTMLRVNRDANEGYKPFRTSWSWATLYARQFYLLLLNELLASPEDLHEGESQSLEAMLRRAKEVARSDMIEFKGKKNSADGRSSAFNTYATSTYAMAYGRGAWNLNDLEKLAEKERNFPYNPEEKDSGRPSDRSSITRNVTGYLALAIYGNQEKKDFYNERLMSSLETWKFHARALVFHSKRRGVHAGEDGLAPYYFLPGTPYVGQAVKLLRSRGGNPEALDAVEEALRISVLSKRESDGFTYGPINEHDAPLAGLALVELLDMENARKKVQKAE